MSRFQPSYGATAAGSPPATRSTLQRVALPLALLAGVLLAARWDIKRFNKRWGLY